MDGRFLKIILILLYFCFSFLLFKTTLRAQEKPKDRPPANVSVAAVKAGMVAPQAEFIGTVFYQEVSDVASELSGLVKAVRIEEGQRVKKGQILVELGSDLLQKSLQATVSFHEQILSELEIARLDLKRREMLFKKKSIPEQIYDENKYRVIGLESRAAALKAQVEQSEIELKKKIILAPFDGIVIKRQVDRGEWVSEGEVVAVLAKDDVVDIVVEVPERFIPFVKKDMPVKASVNSNGLTGNVFTIVPRGDIATRTIPVKIRTSNTFSLIEGMSAKVILPTGERKKAHIVPRDAVISMFGQTVIFAVVESKAVKLPVNIVGYEGLSVGLEARGLEAGLLVVTEGNERLEDGQAVSY